MTVHRLTPLPEATARGRFIVTAAALAKAEEKLRSSQGADGPHEGLVLCAGRTIGHDTVVLASLIVESDHGFGHVYTPEAEVVRATRLARQLGLGVVAQIHSHPGVDTRHSDGDDRLVFMPFEGMFSLVVGEYARRGMTPGQGAGLHQFQDHRWVKVLDAEKAFIVAPGAVG